MATRVLPRAEWQAYGDRISRGLGGTTDQVEVAALDIGDQAATGWLPLIGISYDLKDDLLEIALEGIDHLIARPRRIAVEEGPTGLTSMEVLDAGERQQIVRLKKPLLLPSS